MNCEGKKHTDTAARSEHSDFVTVLLVIGTQRLEKWFWGDRRFGRKVAAGRTERVLSYLRTFAEVLKLLDAKLAVLIDNFENIVSDLSGFTV